MPFALLIGLAVQAATLPAPAHLLQIHRELVKPGQEAAYERLEEATARLSAELGCPHPYLALEALTGPREVWFLNGFASPAEQQHVADDYAKNVRLTPPRRARAPSPRSSPYGRRGVSSRGVDRRRPGALAIALTDREPKVGS